MTGFGALGYALVGGLYVVLTVLLVASSRGQRIGRYLIAACLVSALWSIVLAIQTASGPFHPLVPFIVDILRAGAWITFLVCLLTEIGVNRIVRYAAHLVWIGFLLVGVSIWATQPGVTADDPVIDLMSRGNLAIALTGLLLVEQLYRNSPHDLRWSLKFLALGVGGMFAYDVILFSQAILLGAVDSTTWIARGPVNLFFVPLIALAARRNPTWDLRISVSRQVVFYSASLVGVGLYLLLISIGDQLIVRYGGSWGGVARIVFLVGAAVFLASLLVSNTLRARAKVLLSKHFFQNKYDYREEWLRLVGTLSKFDDKSTRQVVIEAMAQIVESPSGLLWVIDENGKTYQLAASYNSDEQAADISVDDDVVKFMKMEGWLIDLGEFSREPDLYRDFEPPEWLQKIEAAWLIVPLMLGQQLLGLVVLYRAPGLPRLNYEDRDLLKTVGNHIAVHLAQEKSDNLLAEAQQFETYNRLTAFLMHDLNNLIAQQSLIVSNAEKHRRNPEFVDDAIQTIANSVDRMKRVMAQLRRGEADSDAKPAELRFAVTAAVDRCAGKKPTPTLSMDAGDVRLAINPEEITMVLAHLIGNAQDATPPDGRIEVSVQSNSGDVLIAIEDSGPGMSSQFVRERLFRPFDTTKGSQGMGIGAYQAREFARRYSGDLQVDSEVGKGTRITLSLPHT